MSVKEIRIHPAIGIARVGNSPDQFFLGPEVPGEVDAPPGGYRDSLGRIKRQAARFRLFGYDEKGECLGEITADEAEITWTVELVNKKAAAEKFATGGLRNATVQGDQRKFLEIRPGAQSLKGPGRKTRLDGSIKFPNHPAKKVSLGEILTDARGALLVLGGSGLSESPVVPPKPIQNTFNNDEWYDDVSDGPVRAAVKLKGSGIAMQAVSAWVIVGPPKFASSIQHAVTLYDRLLDMAVQELGHPWPERPSLRDEIYPILRRAGRMRWLNEAAETKHKWEETYPMDNAAREHVFNKLRDPAHPAGDEKNMPKLRSETLGLDLTLTPVQYAMMLAWQRGRDFFTDDIGTPRPAPTPQDLDRAVLDQCVGAALYPGIEAGRFLLQSGIYLQPFSFRLDPGKVAPGDVTARMGIPWQTDFHACADLWWPAHRPNQVKKDEAGEYLDWASGVGSQEEMVKLWHTRGFVVRQGDAFLQVGGPAAAPADEVPEEVLATVKTA